MGIEIAGVPKAVHGAFILGSPVDARPSGAGPVAAGTTITGVVLYILGGQFKSGQLGSDQNRPTEVARNC